MKLYGANKISSAESLKMLLIVFGGSALSKTRIYKWYKDFITVRRMVEDLPRSSCPWMANTEENVDKVK